MEGKEIILKMTKEELVVSKCFVNVVAPQHTYQLDLKNETLEGLITVWSGYKLHPNAEADAHLICEAFNVANQTGMTPATLQAELEKAKELIKEAKETIDWCLENLHKPHTSDHFNIPVNTLNELTTFLEAK